MVTVGYPTSDGTATAPADDTAINGTLSFSPGETMRITVPIVGSQAIEPNQQFSLSLVNPVNATLLSDTATGTIETHTATESRPGRARRTKPITSISPLRQQTRSPNSARTA